MKLRVHQTSHFLILRSKALFGTTILRDIPTWSLNQFRQACALGKSSNCMFSVWWNAQNLQVFATSGNFEWTETIQKETLTQFFLVCKSSIHGPWLTLSDYHRLVVIKTPCALFGGTFELSKNLISSSWCAQMSFIDAPTCSRQQWAPGLSALDAPGSS